MKRFFVSLSVFLLIFVSLVLPCFADEWTPFVLTTYFQYGRVDRNTGAVYYYFDSDPCVCKNGELEGETSGLINDVPVNYNTFFSFDMYLDQGENNFCSAGDSVSINISDIYLQYFVHQTQKYYTWTTLDLLEVQIFYADDPNTAVSVTSDFAWVGNSLEFHASFTAERDVEMVRFYVQYWPRVRDEVSISQTNLTLSWFFSKVPTLDVSGVTISQQDITNGLIQDTNDKLGDVVGEIQDTNDKLGEVIGDIQNTNDKLDDTNDKIQDTNDKLNETNDKLDQNSDKLDDINGKVDQTNGKLDEITTYDPVVGTPSGGDAVGGLGSAEQDLIGSVSGGLSGIGDQVDSAIGILAKYSNGLFAVSWILSLFYEIDFLKDLVIFSLALSVIVILFNISLLASNRHGRDARRSSGSRKGG